jgi:hypothetical protein
MSSTSSLGILFIQESQNNKYLTANTAFQSFDSAANAEAAFALTDVATAITLTQAQMASAMVLKLTGALTAARNVIVPAIARFFIIFNASTGGFAVTVKTSGGTGISVESGIYILLFCDGTNVVQINTAGSPAIVQKLNSGSQTGAYSPASYTVPADGLYRASAFIDVLSFSAGATTEIKVTWNDADEVSDADYFTKDDAWTAAAEWDQISQVFFAAGGSTITLTVTMTGTINYQVYYRLERLE